MTLEEIKARLEEIRGLVESGETPETFTQEITDLEARKVELEEIETRKANAAALEAGTAKPQTIIKPEERGEKNMFDLDSKEYRIAWDKYMLGLDMTDEERTAFTHTTGTTSGQTAGHTIPTTLVNKIWDLIEGKHAILGDITIYRTGTILEVVKRTAIAAGDAGTVAEATAPSNDENNTFAKVSLAGKDFAKTVKISYALGIMSIDGFEQFIVNEIG